MFWSLHILAVRAALLEVEASVDEGSHGGGGEQGYAVALLAGCAQGGEGDGGSDALASVLGQGTDAAEIGYTTAQKDFRSLLQELTGRGRVPTR